MARIHFTVFAVAIVLFILAFIYRSPTSNTWSLPSLPSLPGPQKASQSGFSSDRALNSRLLLAEKLWKQSVKDREQMVAAYPPTTQFPDGYINPYHVWDYARPSFFCPHDLERVGTVGDGGKVVCGMSQYEKISPGPSSEVNTAPLLIIYSFGVSTDSSFEAAMLARTNSEVWGYDFSVPSFAQDIPAGHLPRTHFNRYAIGDKTDESRDPKYFTVQDLMAANGHEYIDIVKMDIEGAEFGAMSSLIRSLDESAGEGGEIRPLPFGQLLIELHFGMDGPDHTTPRDLKTWINWWATLEKHGLRPVNNEDNWIGDAISGRPRFIEYTLINVHQRNRNKLL